MLQIVTASMLGLAISICIHSSQDGPLHVKRDLSLNYVSQHDHAAIPGNALNYAFWPF